MNGRISGWDQSNSILQTETKSLPNYLLDKLSSFTIRCVSKTLSYSFKSSLNLSYFHSSIEVHQMCNPVTVSLMQIQMQGQVSHIISLLIAGKHPWWMQLYCFAGVLLLLFCWTRRLIVSLLQMISTDLHDVWMCLLSVVLSGLIEYQIICFKSSLPGLPSFNTTKLSQCFPTPPHHNEVNVV